MLKFESLLDSWPKRVAIWTHWYIVTGSLVPFFFYDIMSFQLIYVSTFVSVSIIHISVILSIVFVLKKATLINTNIASICHKLLISCCSCIGI